MNLDRLKPISAQDVRGQRVLIRADLNVPMSDGRVTDATRLQRLVPGLKDLIRRGAKVIVMSHFGRPKDGPDAANSLRPIAGKLGQLTNRVGEFSHCCSNRSCLLFPKLDADDH